MNSLIEAVISGDADLVKQQLETTWYGAVGENGKNGIHYAAIHGYPEIAELFVEKGLFINRTDYDGHQPLHFAAIHHQSSMVDYLMNNGAAIRAVDYLGNTSLHYAVQNNPPISLIQTLLDYGAVINETNKAGQTPLDIIDQTNNHALVGFLLNEGGHSDSLSPLMVSAILGDAESVVSELDTYSASTTGANGMTGLHYAAYFGHEEVAQEFIDAGLFINRTTYDGLQPMHIAAMEHQLEMVDFLIANGAAILAVDYDGNTPLHYAVAGNPNLDFIESLIQHGSQVNTKNKAGLSALDIAQSEGNTEIVNLLMDHGATQFIDSSEFMSTPLVAHEPSSPLKLSDVINSEMGMFDRLSTRSEQQIDSTYQVDELPQLAFGSNISELIMDVEAFGPDII